MDNLRNISEFLTMGRESLELVKGAVSLMPSGAKRAKAEQRLAAAEAALQRSDAKLAKDLGYPLCECTFPPQIMLWRAAEKAHICPRSECGRRVGKEKSSSDKRPSGFKCPYCGDDTTIANITPHEHFAFAGWKNHVLECVGCGKKTEQPWEPKSGYELKT